MEGQLRLVCMAVHFVQAYCSCITLPAQHMELVGFIGFIGIQNKAWGGGWWQKENQTFLSGPEIDTHSRQDRQRPKHRQRQQTFTHLLNSKHTAFTTLVHFLTELTAGYSVTANQLLRGGRFVCCLALDSRKSACSFLTHAQMSAFSAVY